VSNDEPHCFLTWVVNHRCLPLSFVVGVLDFLQKSKHVKLESKSIIKHDAMQYVQFHALQECFHKPLASMGPCTQGWEWLGLSTHHLPRHPNLPATTSNIMISN